MTPIHEGIRRKSDCLEENNRKNSSCCFKISQESELLHKNSTDTQLIHVASYR